MTFAGPLGALSCAETPWQSVAATAKPKPNSVFETAFMRKILLSERKTSPATFCDSSEQLAILGMLTTAKKGWRRLTERLAGVKKRLERSGQVGLDLRAGGANHDQTRSFEQVG